MKSLSQTNPVYEFNLNLDNSEYLMRFTSVRGHLKGWEFQEYNKSWQLDHIPHLFTSIINFQK